MANKNKCIINKCKSIKQYLGDRKIHIYEQSKDSTNLLITITQSGNNNNYISMCNNDDQYVKITIDSFEYEKDGSITINISNSKKYKYSSSDNGGEFTHVVIIVPHGEIVYKDKYNIYIN